LAFIFSILSQAGLAAEGYEQRAVRIRIHDYANIQEAGLARAQEVVRGMYGEIGVRTDWLDSLRLSQDAVEGVSAPACAPSDLEIIILTSEMATRGVIPDTIIGYAAVEQGIGGRVAYVIYDRIRSFASDTSIDDMRMMGIVMAHEIGHLLMVNQSHSDTGLMRARWQQSEFRRDRLIDLQFSEPQAVEIRKMLGRERAP
jgi:hypothetical protein